MSFAGISSKQVGGGSEIVQGRHVGSRWIGRLHFVAVGFLPLIFVSKCMPAPLSLTRQPSPQISPKLRRVSLASSSCCLHPISAIAIAFIFARSSAAPARSCVFVRIFSPQPGSSPLPRSGAWALYTPESVNFLARCSVPSLKAVPSFVVSFCNPSQLYYSALCSVSR